MEAIARQASLATAHRWAIGPAGTTMVVIGLAFAITMLTIGRESIWFDEGVTVRVGRMGSERFAELALTREPFWALYYALMRPWMGIGDSLILLRLPSAIAGALTVGLTYLVGRRLVGEGAAVVGAVVLAFHAFLLQYAQEARGYALAAALVTAATLCFVLACERRRLPYWIAYAALGIAAIYAHFFCAMVIASHAIALVPQLRGWTRRQTVASLAALAAIAAATWPLASWLVNAEQTRNFVRPITFERLLGAFAWFGGANGKPLPVLHVLLAAAAFAAVVASVVLLFRRWRQMDGAWRPMLLAGWMLLPLVIAIAISLAVKPVFAYRYFLVSLPAVALGVGLVLMRIESVGRRRIAIAVAALAVAIGHWSLVEGYNKPDWNGAAELILESAQPGDVILSQPNWQWTPLEYALDHATGGEIPERQVIRDRPHHAEAVLDRLGREGRRLWIVVFDYYTAPRDHSYPYLEIVEAGGRSRVLDEVFHNVRVMLYVPKDSAASGSTR